MTFLVNANFAYHQGLNCPPNREYKDNPEKTKRKKKTTRLRREIERAAASTDRTEIIFKRASPDPPPPSFRCLHCGRMFRVSMSTVNRGSFFSFSYSPPDNSPRSSIFVGRTRTLAHRCGTHNLIIDFQNELASTHVHYSTAINPTARNHTSCNPRPEFRVCINTVLWWHRGMGAWEHGGGTTCDLSINHKPAVSLPLSRDGLNPTKPLTRSRGPRLLSWEWMAMSCPQPP
jgi:hypothetical protein